jgi:hypothetical protein
MAILIGNRFPKYIGLGVSSTKSFVSKFLTWGQSVPARFWGTETPEYWGGIDPQAQIAYDSLIAAGFTTPQGLGGINAAFSVVKEIYGTSDITTAISFFGDPSLAYQIGAGSGTTLGQAIRTLPNIIDPTRATDAVQTTAASQPLLLVHSGANYWWSVSDSGNFLNSNTTYATSSFDVEFSVNLQGTSTTQRVVNANTTGNPWSIIFNGLSNTITIEYYVGGYRTATCSTSLSGLNTFRISRNSTTGAFTILKNGISQTIGGTQLAGNLDSLPTDIRIGNITAAQGFQGIINWVRLYIGGSIVREMNPNQYNPSTSQTQWTSSTGEVWTISTGTATTGYKGVLVDRNIVQGDGIDDRMQAINYALTATGASVYSTYRKFASTSSGGFGVVVETGANTNTNQGILVDFNEGTNTSFNRIRGNVGTTGASFLDTSVSLKLITSVFDLSLATDEASFYAINNLALTQTGVANVNNTTMTTSGLNLMARSTAAGFANMTFNGIIISSNANGSTQRTAMYNYIRSINNAAF